MKALTVVGKIEHIRVTQRCVPTLRNSGFDVRGTMSVDHLHNLLEDPELKAVVLYDPEHIFTQTLLNAQQNGCAAKIARLVLNQGNIFQEVPDDPYTHLVAPSRLDEWLNCILD